MKKIVVLAHEDRMLMSSLIRLLEGSGFEVEHCRNAELALGMFADKPERPAILVTDDLLSWGALEMGSAETCHGCRTGTVLYKMLRKNHPQLPVILMAFDQSAIEELSRLGDTRLQVVYQSTPTPEICGIAVKMTTEALGPLAKELIQ